MSHIWRATLRIVRIWRATLKLMHICRATPTVIHICRALGCIFLFQECPFLGLCFSFLPGFLRIPWDSCFFRRIFFTGTSFWLDAGIPNYSGITGILRNSCSGMVPTLTIKTMCSHGRPSFFGNPQVHEPNRDPCFPGCLGITTVEIRSAAAFLDIAKVKSCTFSVICAV